MGKMLFEMTFDYKLEFYTRMTDPQLMKNANEFKTGLDCVTTKLHGGDLSPTGRFAEITGNAVLSGLRGDVTVDGKNCYEIRLYDLDGGCEGEISLKEPIKAAFECDFRHIRTADAEIVNGRLKYKLGKKQIKTYIIEV
jgi:hypothetical protein